jgi:hypothetical protein
MIIIRAAPYTDLAGYLANLKAGYASVIIITIIITLCF